MLTNQLDSNDTEYYVYSDSRETLENCLKIILLKSKLNN